MADTLSLSIIVPTYNRGELLIPTITSLIDQTKGDFEIVIVDDGSTDDTDQKVSELIVKNKNASIRYYPITNRERGAARNYGTSVAKGLYVNFFDSDDMAYPNHVSLFAEIISEYNYPEVFALSYDIKDPKGKIILNRFLDDKVSDFITQGNHLSCNGVFIKRQVALENPFSTIRELSGTEDYELWLRLSARYEFPCFPKVSHAVIQHDLRSTMNFNGQELHNRTQILIDSLKTDKEFLSHFGNKSIHKIHANMLTYSALHLILSKHKKEGWKQYFKGVRLNPGEIFNRRTLAIIKHSF